MTVQIQQVSDTFSVSPQLSPADVQTLAEQGIKSVGGTLFKVDLRKATKY